MTQAVAPDFRSLLLVFGLAPGATLDEIKARKQFKTRVTHPDIVAPELRDQATEEVARLNAAWDEIKAWFEEHPEETATPHDAPPQDAEPDNPSEAGNDDGFPDFEDWVENQGKTWGADVSLDIEQLEKQRRRKLAVAARRDLFVKAKFAVAIVLTIGVFSVCFNAKNQSARDAWLQTWRQQAEYAVRHGEGTAYVTPQLTAEKFNRMAQEQKRKWEEEDAQRLPGQLAIIAGIALLAAVQFHPKLQNKTELWIESATGD